MDEDRRATKRRQFGYYMPVMESSTSELVGYLSDISSHGFRLDTPKPLAVNKNYSLRLDLTPDVSDRPFIIFTARVKWGQTDVSDPGAYVEGFEVVNISHHDHNIFSNILEKYGRPETEW